MPACRRGPWLLYCRTCHREGDGNEVVEYLGHSAYECPTVRDLRAQILVEFKLHNDNLSLSAGSVILDILINQSIVQNTFETLNLSIPIPYTLFRLLELNSKKKKTLKNVTIGHIKICLTQILILRPHSNVALTLIC